MKFIRLHFFFFVLFSRGLFGLFFSDLVFQGVEKLHNSNTERNSQAIP